MTRRKPGRFLITCTRCGFKGTRGVRVTGPSWNDGVCKHRDACRRRQARGA